MGPLGHLTTLFIATFTTLLAIINPLEVLPIYLQLLNGKDQQTHRRVALRSCLYAMILMVFFMIFGTLVLKVFGVPLSMVRIVGGIILVRIGFSLFIPSSSERSIFSSSGADGADEDFSFVPLAMPLMFGPGALATVLGMSSMVKNPITNVLPIAAILLAIICSMAVTYLILAYARTVLARIGPKGIDAATRIVGFFVSAMGMGLIFHGVVEALQTYGLKALH
jgi:multiple antibiotic resistance protein